jgi:hypothetical protein
VGGLVVSRVSGSDSFCLAVPAGQPTAGVGMLILRCNTGAVSQRWQLKPTPVTVVPDVTNIPEDIAANKLQSFELQVGTVTPMGCFGTVTGQDALPGAVVLLQTPVGLTVTCP